MNDNKFFLGVYFGTLGILDKHYDSLQKKKEEFILSKSEKQFIKEFEDGDFEKAYISSLKNKSENTLTPKSKFRIGLEKLIKW